MAVGRRKNNKFNNYYEEKNMSLSKDERKSVATTEAITEAIAANKALGKESKEGVDLVGLASKLAERKVKSKE